MVGTSLSKGSMVASVAFVKVAGYKQITRLMIF